MCVHVLTLWLSVLLMLCYQFITMELAALFFAVRSSTQPMHEPMGPDDDTSQVLRVLSISYSYTIEAVPSTACAHISSRRAHCCC